VVAALSTIFKFAEFAIAFLFSKPMELNSNASPILALIEKLPDLSVVTTDLLLDAFTVTPSKGVPLSSDTEPVIFWVCAKALIAKRVVKTAKDNTLEIEFIGDNLVEITTFSHF
jgi:hypothetical protein